MEDSLGLRAPSGTRRFFTMGEEREGGGVGDEEAPGVESRGESNFTQDLVH